jgi:hypothetical protein
MAVWNLFVLRALLMAYNEVMSKSYQAWTMYSIGLFIVWAVIFLVRWKLKSSPDLKDLSLIFFGYFVGWLSATIKFILVSKKIYGPTFSKSEK